MEQKGDKTVYKNRGNWYTRSGPWYHVLLDSTGACPAGQAKRVKV